MCSPFCEKNNGGYAGDNAGRAGQAAGVAAWAWPALVFPCTPFPGRAPSLFYYPIQAHIAAGRPLRLDRLQRVVYNDGANFFASHALANGWPRSGGRPYFFARAAFTAAGSRVRQLCGAQPTPNAVSGSGCGKVTGSATSHASRAAVLRPVAAAYWYSSALVRQARAQTSCRSMPRTGCTARQRTMPSTMPQPPALRVSYSSTRRSGVAVFAALGAVLRISSVFLPASISAV